MSFDKANSILAFAYENAFALNKVKRENSDAGEFIDQSISLAANYCVNPSSDGIFDLGGGLGEIKFPFKSFGNVVSPDLLNLSEFQLFRVYESLSHGYEMALDLGANIGLHSIVMSKAGFNKIVAIDADINHLADLRTNLLINSIKNVEVRNLAVSDNNGKIEFTRVLGNLTGSHIHGSKSVVYGATDSISVESVAISDLIERGTKTFIKMDIEGHENVAIGSLNYASWDDMDMAVEIGSVRNASAIWNYCKEGNLTIFSEKIGWAKVKSIEDMPSHWREGSAILTRKRDFFEGTILIG